MGEYHVILILSIVFGLMLAAIWRDTSPIDEENKKTVYGFIIGFGGVWGLVGFILLLWWAHKL